MATKLGLYNRALQLCGNSPLAPSEVAPASGYLDTAWDNGFVKRVLESGQWNFAIRTRQESYNPSIESGLDGGYEYAFDKPDDWVRTVGISQNADFCPSLTQYEDEADYWWCHVTELFIRYVSDDVSYGGDLSRWPESMAEYAAYQLALDIAPSLTASDGLIERLEKGMRKARADAKSKDAMGQAPQFMPTGSWVRSRGGGRVSRERGNRNSLYG